MSVYYDKAKGRYRFNFDRAIAGGARQRISRLLPKGWTADQRAKFWPITITGWTISHHFTKATRKAGMPWATFHTLRHSTASEMINAGVALNTVGEVLGHKSQASTRRYAHMLNSTKADALRLVGRKVA